MYEVTVGKHHLKTTITVENKGNKFFYVQFMHTILSHARVACSMRWNLLPGYSISQGYISVCITQARLGSLCWLLAWSSHVTVTVLPQLSPPRRLRGYWWIFEEKKAKLSENKLWWTSIESDGEQITPLVTSSYSWDYFFPRFSSIPLLVFSVSPSRWT